MASLKVAILSLENLDKCDLQMINTDCRKFELEYNSEKEIIDSVQQKLEEINCFPGMVYIEKEGEKYECPAVLLRECYTKGRISEIECAEYIFRTENIVSVN